MLRTRASVRPKARVRGIKRTIRYDHDHVIDLDGSKGSFGSLGLP